MIKTALITLFLTFILSTSFGQNKFLNLVNNESYKNLPVLMPDSSLLLFESENSKGKSSRYIYNGKSWESQPNALTSKINSLLLTDKSYVYYLRFSQDFTHLLISMKQFKEFWVYESIVNNGVWGPFTLILENKDLPYSRFAYSYGWDNNTILSTQSSPSDATPNIILNKRTTNGWEVLDTVKVEKFQIDFIDDVLPIGKGLIIYASWKPNKFFDWLYIERIEKDKWSAPVRVNKIFGNRVSFSANGEIYVSNQDGQIIYGETPQYIFEKIKKSRRLRDAEIIPLPVVNKPKQIKNRIIKPTGNSYALLIGNSNYQLDDLDLDNPANDVKELAEVLETNYQFDKENIIKLIDSDRNSILKELYSLRKTLTPEDNLLIFYAGHGYWDEGIGQGYWWPVDATRNNPSNWLSNSDLREQIRGINSAHTLLISDACFSGGIFKTRGAGEIRSADRDIQLLYRMPSRRAITSGTLSTVPDKSVFFKYLIKYLKENEEKFISSSELFSTVRTSVLNNSLTVPQDGVILNTGDEGGDFIFIKK